MNSPGIEAARKLAHLGYRFQVTGSTIKARYKGTGEPNPAQVRPLLALVKEHKKEVLTYLNKPAPRERVLTCADCPHFEANHGPNPPGRVGPLPEAKPGAVWGGDGLQDHSIHTSGNGEASMSKQIFSIPKSSREKVVFSFSEFKGKDYLDMRIFVVSDNGGQDIPTKKGLTIGINLYPNFREGLRQVEAAMIQEGWLDREDLEPQSG